MTDREPWLVFGNYLDAWGQKVPVGMPLRDMRLHMSLLGTTGSGKSTFLRNLALQAYALGSTVIVIEPHGDLILDEKEGILASLPPEALRDVVLVNLNADWPPQINLATTGLGAGADAAVNTAMSCIRVAEDSGWSAAVRMREMLENALLLLLAVYEGNASMVHLQRFFSDDGYRRSVVAQAPPQAAESRDYWKRMIDKFDAKSKGKGGDDESMEVPMRRISLFLRDARFRRSLALPALGNELRIAPLMDSVRPKLLLVPLQGDKLGESVKRVFGTLFMQMVTNAFMARADQSAATRRTTLVLIDEFADMAGSEVGAIVRLLLAQARKFGASLTLATQSINQLPTEVKTELRSNTNIKVVLRTSGRDDAREAVQSFGGDQLAEADILAIEKFCGYAKVMVRGAAQPPFYFQSGAPIRLATDAPYVTELRAAAPQVTQATQKAQMMLKQSQGQYDALVNYLAELDEPAFLAVVADYRALGQYSAEALLNDSRLEPNQVRRALRISQMQWGLPTWLYEAHYRRLRFKDNN